MHRALTISELNYLVFCYLDRLALARARQTCKLVKSAVDEFFNLEQVAPHKLVGLLPAGLVNPHPRWIDPNPRPFIDPLPDELRHLTWHGVTNPPSKTLAGRALLRPALIGELDLMRAEARRVMALRYSRDDMFALHVLEELAAQFPTIELFPALRHIALHPFLCFEGYHRPSYLLRRVEHVNLLSDGSEAEIFQAIALGVPHLQTLSISSPYALPFPDSSSIFAPARSEFLNLLKAHPTLHTLKIPNTMNQSLWTGLAGMPALRELEIFEESFPTYPSRDPLTYHTFPTLETLKFKCSLGAATTFLTHNQFPRLKTLITYAAGEREPTSGLEFTTFAAELPFSLEELTIENVGGAFELGRNQIQVLFRSCPTLRNVRIVCVEDIVVSLQGLDVGAAWPELRSLHLHSTSVKNIEDTSRSLIRMCRQLKWLHLGENEWDDVTIRERRTDSQERDGELEREQVGILTSSMGIHGLGKSLVVV